MRATIAIPFLRRPWVHQLITLRPTGPPDAERVMPGLNPVDLGQGLACCGLAKSNFVPLHLSVMLDLAKIPVLETSRLRLRRPCERDAAGLAGMFADTAYMRFLGDGATADRAAAWRAIAGALGHWVLRDYGLFSVEDKADGVFVGWTGLLDPEGWPGTEIAWGIASPFWGRGYATEAAGSVLHYAFARLRLKRLVSIIHPENVASIRVASKIGERFERVIEFQDKRSRLYAIAAPER